MAFDHRDMALQGLYPGRTTPFSVAIMGHLLFEVEVIIDRAGGAAPPKFRREEDKYTVTVRVTRKGKVWHFQREVSEVTANVMAKLTGIEIVQPEVDVTSVTVMYRADPEIEVEKI